MYSICIKRVDLANKKKIVVDHTNKDHFAMISVNKVLILSEADLFFLDGISRSYASTNAF